MSNIPQPKRVHYFTGESLNTSDFITEQTYFLKRLQSMTYSMGTWGIAKGLSVTREGNKLIIYPGTAYEYTGQILNLENPFTLELNQDQIKQVQKTNCYLIITYQAIESDYTEESQVGGFKRIVEFPAISIQTSAAPTDLVLASIKPSSNNNDFTLNYAIRRYCSLQLGALSFASSSSEDGIVAPSKLPQIAGYFNTIDGNQTIPATQQACLKIDSPETLILGKVTINSSGSTQGNETILLAVSKSAEINGNLNVGGEIRQHGELIEPSPWQKDDGTNIVYYTKSVAIGYKPSTAITEMLSVRGAAQIIGNIICSGAGSKFIGDGSGLTNLPNNPWIIGSNPSQNNIFYPGINSSGGAALGAVGIGPFDGMDVEFPEDASLFVTNKAYIQKLSGLPKEGEIGTYEDLSISSNVNLKPEGDAPSDSINLTITQGDLSIQAGTLRIDSGSIQLDNGNATINGNVNANSFFGDGSHLTGVGYWTQNNTNAIYYQANVLIGATQQPTGSDSQLYVKGQATIDGALTVEGDFKTTEAITPPSGKTSKTGIQFPSNINGGSGDSAWIRYYSDSSTPIDPCTLEIGIANDTADNIFLNPSGNVGIGIASPSTAKLVVQDSIAIVDQGNSRAVSTGIEPLNTIRGTVLSNGSIKVGAGFTAAYTNNGIYQITFDRAYTHEPSVVASLSTDNIALIQSGIVLSTAPTNSGCTIFCYDRSGSPAQCPFAFIATGQ